MISSPSVNEPLKGNFSPFFLLLYYPDFFPSTVCMPLDGVSPAVSACVPRRLRGRDIVGRAKDNGVVRGIVAQSNVNFFFLQTGYFKTYTTTGRDKAKPNNLFA